MKPNPSIPHQMSLGDVKILDWYMNGEMFDIALDQEHEITKRMIEAHQGKIELETFPGGTIFRVILHNNAIQGERA